MIIYNKLCEFNK